MKNLFFLAAFALFLHAEPTFEQYDANCTAGDGISCADIGAGLYNADQVDKAIEYLDKGCKLNTHAACDLRAYIYMRDNKIDEAIKIFKTTCDQNSSYGCLNLGVIYYDGQGVEVDRKKSKEYIIKSCKMKNTMACEMLNTF